MLSVLLTSPHEGFVAFIISPCPLHSLENLWTGSHHHCSPQDHHRLLMTTLSHDTNRRKDQTLADGISHGVRQQQDQSPQ
jgi:hypothetical protein